MSDLSEKNYSTNDQELDALLEYYDMIDNGEILTNVEEKNERKKTKN